MNTLELALVRYGGTKNYTAGRMYANGVFLCYTLEDEVRELDFTPVREWKVPAQTAIPRGRYRVVMSMSPKFGRMLPEVQGVVGFTGVRMHRGNKTEHTEGCLLLGMSDGNDQDAWLGNSVQAENFVIARIENAISEGKKVYVTLV